jgi:hypothetical protein
MVALLILLITQRLDMHLFNTHNYKKLEHFFNMITTQFDQAGLSPEIKSRLWAVFHGYWPWAMTQEASKNSPEKRLYELFKTAIETALTAHPDLANAAEEVQARALAEALAQSRLHKTRAWLEQDLPNEPRKLMWNPAKHHMANWFQITTFHHYEPRELDTQAAIQTTFNSIYRALTGEDTWPELPHLPDPLPPTPEHIKKIAHILIKAGISSVDLATLSPKQLMSAVESELNRRGLSSTPPSNTPQ